MTVAATDVPHGTAAVARRGFAARLVGAAVRNRLHLIVCSAVALWAWPAFLDRTVLPIDFLIVPLTVATVYEWNRLTDRREDAINCPEDLNLALRHRGTIALVCAAGLATVVVATALTFRLEAAALLAALLLLGFFYGTPVVPSRPQARLKSLFVVKNVASAGGWALLTLVYPLLHAQQAIDSSVWFAAAAMLIGVVSSELIWDVRDAAGDAQSGIRSVPVRLGTRAVSRILVVLNAAFTLVIVVGVAAAVWPPQWLFVATSSLLCLAVAGRLSRFSDRRWTHLVVAVQVLLLGGLGLVGCML